jgi:hypothetical protein
MTLKEMQTIPAAEMACLEDMISTIEEAVRDAWKSSLVQGLDQEVIEKATVTMLLITAGSTAGLNGEGLDSKTLSHSFVRCATEIIDGLSAPPCSRSHEHGGVDELVPVLNMLAE